MTAMGGKYAVDDNREVPDTLEVLWQYPGNTLVDVLAVQLQRRRRPASTSGEIEFRGTKGTLYIQGNGYEVVPDVLTHNEFPARTPVDRAMERGYREGAKPVIEARKETGGKVRHGRPRPQLPRLRRVARAVQLRHRDRPPRHHGRPDRQHRLEDEIVPGMGRQGGAVHQQRGGEQAACATTTGRRIAFPLENWVSRKGQKRKGRRT